MEQGNKYKHIERKSGKWILVSKDVINLDPQHVD